MTGGESGKNNTVSSIGLKCGRHSSSTAVLKV